jgi:pyrimidine-nucleoside phosphorylase
MRAVDLIERKRDGAALTAADIRWLVAGFTSGAIPDYQMAALLMAVVWRGMSAAETTELTYAMRDSGATLNLRERINPIADKHSTGGVGDKVTLAVAPLVAACGLPVAKMSGRGLAHTGGTIDKLEAIPGLRTDLPPAAFLDVLTRHGLALAGQSAELAPADGKIYALRDVTGTVASIPLIASSIMSKKLAIGCSHLLLDVKVGAGAFMKTRDDAHALARLMVTIGQDADMRTVAVLSAMDQPLGAAVGNALELAEAIAILRGAAPTDVTELCLHEAATLLAMAGIAAGVDDGHRRAQAAISSGRALAKLAEVAAAQGGDPQIITEPWRLPTAAARITVPAPRDGYLAAIDAERVGLAAMRLGAGRARKGDAIDHATGLRLLHKVGDTLHHGDPLVEIHARSAEAAAAITPYLLEAYRWSDTPARRGALIYETIE